MARLLVHRRPNPMHLFSDFDRLFRTLAEGFPGGPLPAMGGFPSNYAPMNLLETKDAFVAEIALPGINPGGLDISLRKGTLTVSGTWGEPTADDETNYLRRERPTGAFTRTAELTEPVQEDAVKAEYLNGILRVTMPKAPEARPRQITVEVK